MSLLILLPCFLKREFIAFSSFRQHKFQRHCWFLTQFCFIFLLPLKKNSADFSVSNGPTAISRLTHYWQLNSWKAASCWTCRDVSVSLNLIPTSCFSSSFSVILPSPFVISLQEVLLSKAFVDVILQERLFLLGMSVNEISWEHLWQ